MELKEIIKKSKEFTSNLNESELSDFSKLAKEQNPKVFFITCSDSRIVPGLFTETQAGDLFMHRNVGNIIPPANQDGTSTGDVSELAALEFAVEHLKVKDIVICGHSECGAMKALLNPESAASCQHLSKWIKQAAPSKVSFETKQFKLDPELSEHNALSQANVLQQILHLKSYPFIQKKVSAGELNIHAWWFDIARASISTYSEDKERFEIL